MKKVTRVPKLKPPKKRVSMPKQGKRLWYATNIRFVYNIFMGFSFAAVLLTGGMILVIDLFGEAKIYALLISPFFASVALLIVMLITGTVFTFFATRSMFRPIHKLHAAMEQVARGNMEVRIVPSGGSDEMRQLTVHFNEMVEHLSKIETFKNDFIANVSHEFKTPLTTILGYSGLLSTPNLSEEDRLACADGIKQAVEQLNGLTTNILKLSKLENTSSLDKAPFSLDEQLRHAVLAQERVWTEREIEWNIDLCSLSINANEEMLATVWSNLISNAIKFSHRGGTVDLRLAREGEYAVVQIADHGIGMSEETRSHIFDKFYQGDTSRSAQGNGLGLAMVKRIVELSQGTVQVHSKPDHGTLVAVYLPL